jgi:sterol desaturase/sphingolipid hydroxylase (fatty acid hydroxylase superfamily)
VDGAIAWFTTTYGWIASFWWSLLPGGIALLIAERLLPVERSQPLRALGLNVFASTLHVVVTPVASFLPGMVATWVVRNLSGPWIPLDLNRVMPHDLWLRWPVILAALWVSLAVYDFFYYWFHRGQHAWPWLWEQHRLHHLDRAVSMATAYRHHWLEEPLRAVLMTLPMSLIFGLTPIEGGVLSAVASHWALVIHANLRVRFGVLSAVVAGPQYHRIHHSLQPEHWNKNLAAFVPLWDWLFGTYHRPRSGEWPATGLATDPEVTSVRAIVLGPFPVWWTRTRALLLWRPAFGRE